MRASFTHKFNFTIFVIWRFHVFIYFFLSKRTNERKKNVSVYTSLMFTASQCRYYRREREFYFCSQNEDKKKIPSKKRVKYFLPFAKANERKKKRRKTRSIRITHQKINERNFFCFLVNRLIDKMKESTIKTDEKENFFLH